MNLKEFREVLKEASPDIREAVHNFFDVRQDTQEMDLVRRLRITGTNEVTLKRIEATLTYFRHQFRGAIIGAIPAGIVAVATQDEWLTIYFAVLMGWVDYTQGVVRRRLL